MSAAKFMAGIILYFTLLLAKKMALNDSAKDKSQTKVKAKVETKSGGSSTYITPEMKHVTLSLDIHIHTYTHAHLAR